MPTPAERKALAAALVIAALGGGARVLASRRPEPAAGIARQLDRQIARVDSARKAGRQPRGRVSRGDPSGTPSAGKRTKGKAAPSSPIDIDRASAEELAHLPSVGPALAGRIVAARDSCGGLGSLDALDRVRGIGSALLRRVAPLVTFSATPRTGCQPSAATPGRARERAAGRVRRRP